MASNGEPTPPYDSFSEWEGELESAILGPSFVRENLAAARERYDSDPRSLIDAACLLQDAEEVIFEYVTEYVDSEEAKGGDETRSYALGRCYMAGVGLVSIVLSPGLEPIMRQGKSTSLDVLDSYLLWQRTDIALRRQSLTEYLRSQELGLLADDLLTDDIDTLRGVIVDSMTVRKRATQVFLYEPPAREQFDEGILAALYLARYYDQEVAISRVVVPDTIGRLL